MANKLTKFILFALVLGVIVGWATHSALDQGTPESAALLKSIADNLGIVTSLFLRLIKMIIAPLVFSTLVVGIAHMGDTAALGRVGARSLGWFIGASLVSLSLGLLLVNLLQPGVGLNLPLPAVDAASGVDQSAFSLKDFITHVVPSSIADAMAKNDILPIVVFSVFFGVAITAVGEAAKPLVRGIEGLVQVMLQITNYVMRFAPFAVFGAIGAVVATKGLGIVITYGVLIGEFYFGLALLWVILLAIGGLFLGKRIFTLIRYIREPLLLTFSTASSEAGLPKLFEQLDRFGVPRRLSGFVLPLGYSFNLDGSMMYMSFATIFIAQAYGIELSWTQQILMLLTLMITSKGIAGVPRASLVVIAATLSQFGLPVEGIALILGIDQFLDMGRSATNIVGNAVATSVITKWEGMLEKPEPIAVEPPHAPSRTPARGKAGLDLDSTT